MLHLPSALFYATMSIFMVFSNKYVITTWQFNNPILLILLEMILNIVLIHLFSRHQSNLNQNANLSSKLNIGTAPLNLSINIDSYSKYQYMIVFFYCFHSVLSLKALSGLNIPMYVMFKRCVPFANLLISIFIFKNVNVRDCHTQKIIFSILIMTFGVVIAGYGDMDFDLVAYTYCAASVLCQAGYLSSIQKHGESSSNVASSSSLQSLYDCSVLSLPVLTVIFLLSDEPVQTYEQLTGFSRSNLITFLIVLGVNLFSGSLLCFSQFWCTLNNNAITTSVLGVLKSMLQTILGILLFQSFDRISNLTFLGIMINFVFGIHYTYLKHKEHKEHSSLPEKV